MSQKKIYEISITNIMDISTIKECEGLRKGITLRNKDIV